MSRVLIVAWLAAASVAAQEVAVPDKPVDVTVKAFAIVSITSSRDPDYRFTIGFTDDHGKRQQDEHFGPSWVIDPVTGAKTPIPTGAEDLIKQMNTANMSVKSMNKRALEHLIAHGKIPPSTVQGTPQLPGATELDKPPVVPKPPAAGPTVKGTVPPVKK